MERDVQRVIIGLSPFERPDVPLVTALDRAGALGVLDLGHDLEAAATALRVAARQLPGPFGIRIPEFVDAGALSLPEAVRVVVLPASTGRFQWPGRSVLSQVSSIEEARAALAGGADGLIVKGHEAGGCVGDETTFVLLQRVLLETPLPVWAQGGIGLHTAAACVAAGARGVVFDSQLALLEGATTPPAVTRLLAAFDGSETAVCGGYRIYARAGARKPESADGAAVIAANLGTGDPAQNFIAVGQDAAFARRFSERFTSVGRFVSAVRTAIDGHLRQARALEPLAPGAPLAADHGVTYPIAQGPMTRVSDRAAFADAVSAAGALPFLALSLMRGPDLRGLLLETSERLAGRTWGAGILGFLPAETRDEQIALLLEIKPPVALIAGGRPSQALPLEQAGIKTYLHVPSPGLLELFLKEGARRFVFEGRECGGHVGPRSSFVLWESAIEALLEQGTLHGTSLLFAGGIHDALSATMVAVLAAPLAARGAKVGVLMGTAYLFTDAAVECGAIQPAFQDEAIRCERTTLLETAPGHATRCAESTFARTFEDERRRLEAEGADAQTAWAALEALNLGRLRLASKGIKREGDALIAVDEAEQRRDGMYMIGQIAALRSERCTLDELHRDVSEGATAALAAREPAALDPGAKPLDIAIVGMACIFPDAPDLPTYWANIISGHNAVREIPPGRWNVEAYYDPAGTGDTVPSKWGGFLPATTFDPSAYGIPPRSLASIDPTQLLALEVAKRALDDAGCDERPFDRERASVVFGTEPGGDFPNAYSFRGNFAQFIDEMPPELEASLPKLTEDSFPGVLGNVVAGRIANRLDLRGANFTVDAACASSLTALHVACKELASGSSDLVIAGGADLHNGIHDYQMFACVHALSKTGQSRPFDAGADGIALGEGVACVVLKRLADAERDGDRIYAIVKGVGASSDGKSLGLTAPRKEGQLRALERAWSAAGTTPAAAGLIEAHGTGTVVGDRTELSALEEFFGAAGAAAGSCTLGSVKGQIGHTKCAAGLAGLVKSALAIYHGVLPPTKNLSAPHASYDAATSPFVFRDVAVPWKAERRVAGVSAFGFGGTNFHVVLEAPPTPTPADEDGMTAWPAELFVIRGASDEHALATLAVLDGLAASDVPPALRDLAASAAHAAPEQAARFAFIARSHADLREKVAALRAGRFAAGALRVEPAAGEVAFLFPGQGSQRPKMLAELFVAFPHLRDLVALGARWYERMFPGAAFTPETRIAQLRAITETDVAQPALGIADLAVARLLANVGVAPSMAAGHSYGELVALSVAGTFDAAALIELSTARARSILEAAPPGAPGTMAAVRATPDAVREVLGDDAGIVLANHNAPDQIVIAGSESAIADACVRLNDAGLKAKPLSVACAFHSPIVAGARERFAAALELAAFAEPNFPVYSNADAAPYPSDGRSIRAMLAEHVIRPVRFVDEIEAMYAAGARTFIEVGPGAVLSDLTGRILRGRPHVAVACDAGEGGLAALLDALARLAAAGVTLDVRPLFAGRATPLDLDAPPACTAPATAWLVDGAGARPLRGELPDFAQRPLAARVSLRAATPVAADEREENVRLYLHSVRELIEGQRQVMLRYLDANAAPLQHVAAATPARPILAAPATPPSAPAPGAEAPVPVAAPAVRATPMDALLATVSERTGYPIDMLDRELDIEADLGIDSIKRIEILGAVREKLGQAPGGADDAAFVERLAAAKTLREIAALLEAGAKSEAPADAAPPDTAETLAEVVQSATPALEALIERHVVVVEPAPATPEHALLRGRTFAIVPDALGIAPHLAAALGREGAVATLAGPGEALGEGCDLVFLATLGVDSPEALHALFARVKEAVNGGARTIVAATAFGGSFGHHAHPNGVPPTVGGVAGLLKSVAKEHPDLLVRAIDLDPGTATATLAEHVLDELGIREGPLEIGYIDGVRRTLTTASRTAGERSSSPLRIGPDAVVLITGGARGITARIAVAMARRYGCTFELIGRSLPGEPEDAELAAARDAAALRRVLVSRMNGAAPGGPAAVETEVRRILAGREITATLEAVRAAGGRADYHAVDVRDEAAFGALIDRLRERHGRIDGVVHGAGLIEDKLLRDKTPDSFARVFSTKVVAARTLAAKLSNEVLFFVMFSSISGAFGNRGQSDYAAANDALDKLAHHLFRTVPGRVLSINWGPWSGAGMVGPELEREYERRGIGLIPLEAGIERFFEELHAGADAQVILSAAGTVATV